MNRKLLIICALALTSCAPLLQTVQGEPGSLSRDGSAILLNNPGPGSMTEAVVRVEGPGLVLGAPCELRAVNVYGCVLGEIPAGSKYRLTPTAGTVSRASANFYRGTSALFRRLELP